MLIWHNKSVLLYFIGQILNKYKNVTRDFKWSVLAQNLTD